MFRDPPIPEDAIKLQLQAQFERNFIDTENDPILKKHLRAYTLEKYKTIMQNQEVPAFFQTMTLNEMAAFSYHLLVFGLCLDAIATERELYKEKYLDFLKNNNRYTETLNSDQANPFVLREHVRKLYIDIHKFIDSGVHHPKAFEAFMNQLTSAQKALGKFDSGNFASFKLFIDGCIKFTMAKLVASQPASNNGKRNEALLELYEGAVDSFAKANKTAEKDNSVSVYGQRMMFKNPIEAEEKLKAEVIELRREKLSHK